MAWLKGVTSGKQLNTQMKNDLYFCPSSSEIYTVLPYSTALSDFFFSGSGLAPSPVIDCIVKEQTHLSTTLLSPPIRVSPVSIFTLGGE